MLGVPLMASRTDRPAGGPANGGGIRAVCACGSGATRYCRIARFAQRRNLRLLVCTHPADAFWPKRRANTQESCSSLTLWRRCGRHSRSQSQSAHRNET